MSLLPKTKQRKHHLFHVRLYITFWSALYKTVLTQTGFKRCCILFSTFHKLNTIILCTSSISNHSMENIVRFVAWVIILYTLILGHQISITSLLIHVNWNTIFRYFFFLIISITCRFIYLPQRCHWKCLCLCTWNTFHLCPTGGIILDDVMPWKRFPHYWNLVRRILRWPVDFPNQYSVCRILWVVVVSCEMPLDTQSRFGTPWSLRDVTKMYGEMVDIPGSFREATVSPPPPFTNVDELWSHQW